MVSMSVGKRMAMRLPLRRPPRRQTVDDVVIQSLQEQLDVSKTLGFGLSSFFFLTTMTVIFIAVRYPWFFGIKGVCQ